MKKVIILVLTVILGSFCVKAQINEMAYHLDADYYHHNNKPIVRYYSGGNFIVSYYEEGFNGVFVLHKYNSLPNDTIKLPTGYYAYDFEILDDVLYFCGEKVRSSVSSSAIVGNLDLSPFLNPPGNVHLEIDSIFFDRDIYKLNKMIAYEYNNPITQNVEHLIMAIGNGKNFDDNNVVFNDHIDFFVAKSSILSSFVWLDTFPNHKYFDITATTKHIVLIGRDLRLDFFGFKKIEKDNPISSVKDTFYHCSLQDQEPLTSIVAENIEGTDEFVTATFASIGGADGTVVRRFNAGTTNMINSQFIPLQCEKDQPYELQHIHGTGTLLLLQGCISDSIGSVINYLNYTRQSNYSSIFEAFPEFEFYSIDKYFGTRYIAMGYSATNPAYLIRNINLSARCVKQYPVNIGIISNHAVSPIYDYMPCAITHFGINLIIVTSNNVNFIIDCR